MAGVHDGGVIGVVLKRRIELGDGVLEMADEGFAAVLRHEHIVGRDAGLAGIQELARGDAFGRDRERCIASEDTGRLAAKLQGDGRQVRGGGGHDVAADRGRAGVEQVVEGQGSEGRPRLRPAKHGCHPIRRGTAWPGTKR